MAAHREPLFPLRVNCVVLTRTSRWCNVHEESRNKRSGSCTDMYLFLARSQTLPAVMPAATGCPAAVAIPTWPAPVIHRRGGYDDARAHIPGGWWRIYYRRSHHDRRGLADRHTRQRDPNSDAETNTGVRGRNGPE